MLSDDAKNRVLDELVFMTFTGNLNLASEEDQPDQESPSDTEQATPDV